MNKTQALWGESPDFFSFYGVTMTFYMNDKTRIDIYQRIDKMCSDSGYIGVSVDLIADIFNKYSRTQIYTALETLTEMGFLIKEDVGRNNIYKPNPDY